MAGPETNKNLLARSQRAAAIAASLSGVFGTVIVIWGASLHSVVMTAGGILALSRAVMGVFIIAGMRLSRHHSKAFPDGLYKLENIFSIVIGVIILVLTYEVARISIQHLGGVYVLTSDPKYALPFFLAAAALAGGLGYYKLRVANAEGCPSLKADSYFSFVDAIAMIIIGAAMAIDIAGFHRVDAIAGLLVACFMAVIGVQIFITGLKVLLDASVSSDILSKVAEVARVDPGVRKVVSVDGRNSGSFIFLHVEVETAAYDLSQAGEISRELERRIKASVQNVDRVSIEFSAPADIFIAAVPVGSDGNTVDAGFESAPKIAFIEVDSGTLSGQPEVVDNPVAGASDGRGIRLAVYLGTRPADVLLLKEDIKDDEVRETLEGYTIDTSTVPALSDLDSASAALERLAKDRKPVVAAAEAATG